MKDVVIRNLKLADYDDVYDLEKQVYNIHYIYRSDIYNDVNSLFPKEFYNSIIQDNDAINIGIECNKEIVAVLLASIKETNNISIVKKRRFCFIDDIVVDKSYRRKGFAKRLFEELKLRLKKLNVQDIELVVWPFNKEAIGFYESLGMSVKNLRYELKTCEDINTEIMEIKTSQKVKEKQ